MLALVRTFTYDEKIINVGVFNCSSIEDASRQGDCFKYDQDSFHLIDIIRDDVTGLDAEALEEIAYNMEEADNIEKFISDYCILKK